MPKTVHAVLAQLFTDEKPPGPSRDFSWRLIQRRRRPFLLLPTTAMSPRVSLTLYSAQRRRAKIWRAAMPWLLNTPAAMAFHRIHFRAGDNSRIIRFLSDQSGVPVDQLCAPAIKFGGLASNRSRLVLLICDLTNRPLKVIKLGLDAAGRAATDREADLLEKLPANTVGCIRLTGRLSTPELSAFATDFFAGESPENDLGMELLFCAWINPGSPVPVESLAAWHELEAGAAAPAAWQALRAALAGRSLRSTLYHGDFAPWNIRAVNTQQLRAFDWERGRLAGIPGWDWFHFVVQTSILARRHSVERVAAELEELLQSQRFQKYAAAAGIQAIVKPLALAYLLHHRWVFKPLDGAGRVEELFELLAARWELSPDPRSRSIRRSASTPAPDTAPPGLWADARGQLNAAWSQLANVFWEPNLTAAVQPSFSTRLKSAWPLVLFCSVWLVAAVIGQYYCPRHILLLPVYTIPCLLAGWRINRRWGMFFAALAAVAGPVVGAVRDPSLRMPDLLCWNALMRFLILQMCVFLADRIHRQEDFFDELIRPGARPANYRRNWAILLFSALWFLAIAAGDIWTGPRVSFLPLYLFPAMLVTLFLNLGWGAFTVLLGAFVVSLEEYVSRYNASLVKVFAWNFPMRFLMLFLVILLLNRLRHDNVLFTPRESNGDSQPGHQP